MKTLGSWAAFRRRVVVIGALVALLGAGMVGTVAEPAAAAPPCDPLTNAIACENTLPGNPPSEWDITGVGDPTLQGFSTQFSVDQGQTVGFKVDTTAAAYTIDIYRVGWYQGNGARRITTLPAPLAQDQPNCLSDATTGLVDCGNWSQSSSWSVPSDAVSGVYFARLRRPDTGGMSHIFFVVRDDDGGSKMVFQTNDTTWHAYNGFGGNSLYGGSPAGRAYKVSYNRPFDTGASWPHTFFWQDQYPMIRFMERNGYDMSYISGIDADASGDELLEHEVFVSSGHDEYYSKQQRANVEAARDAGVNLAFLSGNLMLWKTRWEPSIDGSGTARRTMVSYKETHAGAKIDPSPQWTGSWRDPRFSPPSDGGNPENKLVGTLFTVNGIRNDTVTVPQADGLLRLWRNTSVATQAVGATASLATGSLGYEWDEVPDDGTRPPGLIRLSDTTVPINDGKYLLDYGSVYGNGTARHSLAMYKAASGALVFSAGTIRWPYGLATENADNTGAVEDVRMQQATVNLFADMGAQPGTLQSGLTPATASTDTVRPTATITSPATGTTVQTGQPVTITGTATDSGGRVAGVEISFDGGATWRLATGRATWSYVWTPLQLGTTTVRVRAIDDSANQQSPAATISVTSNYTCPCSIFPAATVPPVVSVPEALPVELGVKFRSDVAGQVTGVRFYKGTANTGSHTGQLWSESGTLLATALFTGESASGWQQATFSSPVTVQADTTYVVSYFAPNGGYAAAGQAFLNAGADNGPLHALQSTGASGNGVFKYGATSTFPDQSFNATNYFVDVVFATGGGGPDTTPPTVTGRTPAVGATGVSTGAAPTATFSEPVQAATVGFALAVGSTPVAGTSTYSASTNTATFTPSAALTPSTTYTATVSGVRDTAGNLIAAPVSWSFTTASAAGTCPCSIWSAGATPAAIAADPDPVELGVKFRSDTPGYVSGVRFYKGAGNTGTHTGSLWNTSGTRLATATFTGESATGWQQVTFSSPVAITANTTYIASYFAPNGRYGVTGQAFAAAGVDNAPLHALRAGVDGGNGVYKYGATSAFPDASYLNTNYWVDVVFTSTPPPADTTPPTVSSVVPTSGATGVATGATPSATFSEAVQSATIGFTLAAGSTPVAGTVGYNASTNTATFTPTAALATSTVYSATISGARDTAGNTIAAPYSWSFTTAAAPPVDTTPPTVTASTPAAGATGVSTSAVPTATFSEAVQTATIGFALAAGSTPVAGTTTYNATTRVASFAPSAVLSASTTYTATISGVRDTAGNTIAAPFSWSFTTASAGATCPCSIWSAGATPAAIAADPDGVEVGVKFRSDVAGQISGVRFYKGAGNTGTHIGNLWSASGALLASATFTGESATGWQQVNFSSPVAVNAGTTYVASYYAPNGNYAVTGQAFAAAGVDNPPLRALRAGVDGGNGVYKYGPASTFPDASYLSTNYWVDVVLTTGPPPVDTTPPTVTARTPAVGATGIATSVAPTATFSEAVQSATVGFALAIGSTPVAGSTSYNASTNTATFTPSTALATSTTYTATISGVRDTAGNLIAAPVSWSFTTAAAPPVDTTPPTVTGRTPAVGATGIATSVAPTATFSEAVQSATVGFALAIGSTPVAGSTSYSASTNTATFTPSTALATSTTYTATISGVRDTAGNLIAAPVSWSFTTAAPGPTCPCSIWGAGATPAAIATDPDGVEVGVKFRSDVAGQISGVRFYKGAGNTGTHVGNLWSAGGALLATATFSGESATGWQQVNFSSPVSIAANTTYVASYFAPNGRYGVTGQAFASTGVDNAPLHALSTAAGGGNGVYKYGTTSAFPNETFLSTNYWVDVVLTTGPDTTAPTVTGRTPAVGATGVSTGVVPTATFSEAVQAGTIGFALAAGSTPVTGTVGYNSSTNTASFTPTVPLAASTTYTATISGVRDTAGNTIAGPVSWSFTTAAAPPVDTTPPTVTGRTPAVGATGVSTGIAPTATFSESVQSGTIGFALATGSTPVAGTTSYNGTTNTATFTPTAPLTGATTYTATVSGVRDTAGNQIAAPASWSFTTASGPSCPCSIFAPGAAPAAIAVDSDGAVELGVKFRSDVAGQITGVRFYKGAGMSGTHVGNLWSASGTRLATATFTGESASGWQQVNFSAPVSIAANTTYVASFFAPDGRYGVTGQAFTAAGVDNAPLHALRAGVDGANGVYKYGATSVFPTDAFINTNYFVDVVFTT